MGHRLEFKKHCSMIYYQEIRILNILDFIKYWENTLLSGVAFILIFLDVLL